MGDTIRLVTHGFMQGKQLMKFYKVNSNSFCVSIRGQEHAFIRLTWEPTLFSTVSYKIRLGTAHNQESSIEYDDRMLKTVLTPDILSSTEYRTFGIIFANKTISVYRDGMRVPIMSCKGKHLSRISYVSFGNRVPPANREQPPVFWMFEIPPKIPDHSLSLRSGGEIGWYAFHGQVPAEAFIGAIDEEPLYVVRGPHQGSLTPGYYARNASHAYLSWGEAAHRTAYFEVLCGYKMQWETWSDDELPLSAVPGGYSEQGEILYIARARLPDGSLRLGKVQQSHGTAYFADATAETEVPVRPCEILVAIDENADSYACEVAYECDHST